MRASSRMTAICVLLSAGCAAGNLAESDYVRSLTANAAADETDPSSIVVSVDTSVHFPNLWQTCQVFLVTSTDELPIGEFTTPVGDGGYATNVAVDDVVGVSPTSVAIRIDYSVYRGRPSEGTLLFSGTVTKKGEGE